MLVEPEEQTHVEKTVAQELHASLLDEPFAINPEPAHPLYAYGAWPWRDCTTNDGSEQFTLFCQYLSQLSRIVVDLAEHGCFDSEERVEIAHEACSMLECTEYGLLSTTGMQVGYYYHLVDHCHLYLSISFPKEATSRSP